MTGLLRWISVYKPKRELNHGGESNRSSEWRLKDRDENRKCASKVDENIEDIKVGNQLEALLLDTAKSVIGQTTGKGADNEKDEGGGMKKCRRLSTKRD